MLVVPRKLWALTVPEMNLDTYLGKTPRPHQPVIPESWRTEVGNGHELKAWACRFQFGCPHEVDFILARMYPSK